METEHLTSLKERKKETITSSFLFKVVTSWCMVAQVCNPSTGEMKGVRPRV
jgi:hypothetical protein